MTQPRVSTSAASTPAEGRDGSDLIEALDQLLTEFRSGQIRLSEFIDTVPPMVKQLNINDVDWKDRFVGYWWTLEQVQSEAIDVGESRRLPQERRETVDEAINGMVSLVAEAKEDRAGSDR